MAALSPQLKQAMSVPVDRGEGVYLFDEESATSGEQVDQTVEIWTKAISAAEGGG